MVKPGDLVRVETPHPEVFSSGRVFVVVDVTGDGAIVLRDPDDLAGENLFAVEEDELA